MILYHGFNMEIEKIDLNFTNFLIMALNGLNSFGIIVMRNVKSFLPMVMMLYLALS